MNKIKCKYKILLQYYFSHDILADSSIYKKNYFGKSILEYSLLNLLDDFSSKDIVVFISHDLFSDRINKLLMMHNVEYKLVSTDGISKTIVNYINKFTLTYFVRVIANNPFVESQLIQNSLRYLDNNPADYLTFVNAPKGLTPSEVLNSDSLKKQSHSNEFYKYIDTTKDINILSYSKKKSPLVKQFDSKFNQYQKLDLSINSNKDLNKLGFYLKKNIKPNLDKLSADYIGKIVMAHIEPTNQCNLDCIMCARLSRKSFGTLHYDKYIKIMDALPDLKRINFNGDGEPFLNKNLPKMLAYAKKRGILTRTITNAMVPVSDEYLEEVLENLDFFNISLDGATAQSFESIRLKGDFNLVCKNIKQIIKVINNNSFLLDEFWVNCVIQFDNHTEIKLMVEKVSELGVKALNFKLLNTNYDRGGDVLDANNLLVRDRMAKSNYKDINWILSEVNEAKELGKKLDVDVFLERDIDYDFSYHKCGLSQKIFITHDGWVTPCCLRPDSSVYNFGNLLNQTYDEIFASQKYNNFVLSLIEEKPKDICLRCPSFETVNKHRQL